MSPRRILVVLVLLVAVVLASGGPAVAAKPLPTPPEITSAVAVDSRTVDLTWTAVKGADHYVVTAPGLSPVYATATTARITDLYPGDLHAIYVTAETRRNASLGTSATLYVATPPEGPRGPLGWAEEQDGQVRIWSGSGLGCVTQDLGILASDGIWTSLGDGVDQGGPRTWTIFQGAGTTQTYAVRCQGSGGLWSPWSEPPTVVTLP